MRKGRLALLAIAVAGTIITAAASAPGGAPISVSDPTGDNQTAPDVTGLTVLEDGERVVSEIKVADRTNRLEDGEFLVFYVDSDANAATGSRDGGDYLIEYEQKAPTESLLRVYRWSSAKGEFTFDGSFNSSFGRDWGRQPSTPGTLRVFFKPKVFGVGLKVNIWARSESAGDDDNYTFDRVPNSGSVSLAVTDTAAPAAKALPSAGRSGGVAKLSYRVTDVSGQAREVVTIKKGAKTLGTVRTKLHPAVAGKTYSAPWRVPAAAKGALRFCVQAFDAAGNASAQSCAPLVVR